MEPIQREYQGIGDHADDQAYCHIGQRFEGAAFSRLAHALFSPANRICRARLHFA
ncbi:hypothetical protein D3C81_1965650 [compost metagenome]